MSDKTEHHDQQWSSLLLKKGGLREVSPLHERKLREYMAVREEGAVSREPPEPPLGEFSRVFMHVCVRGGCGLCEGRDDAGQMAASLLLHLGEIESAEEIETVVSDQEWVFWMRPDRENTHYGKVDHTGSVTWRGETWVLSEFCMWERFDPPTEEE